jgi:hypothetical protein
MHLGIAALCLILAVPAHVRAAEPLRVSQGAFVRGDGARFDWRGVTAFRLAELIAAGREQDARAYLAWGKAQQVTVVRVLAMAHNAFQLPPDKGRAAMARLLPLAASHGIAVEIVALADTASYQFDLEGHVRELGQLCAREGLCTVEIANEPYHGTQDPKLHDRSFLARLRTVVPADVPVALGAGNSGEESGGGDYVTVHFPRERDWGHVAALAEGAALRAKLKAPLVNDEPIGAAEAAVDGRRDASPERFRAAALVATMAGVGSTFHYDGGIHAKIPEGRQAMCFAAWISAWTLLPSGPLTDFRELAATDPLTVKGAAHAWVARAGADTIVLAIGLPASAPVSAATGWTITSARRWTGSGLWRLSPTGERPRKSSALRARP